MKGLKIWLSTLIEYDAYGNATVLMSFAKPAKDSPIKGGKKKIAKRKEITPGETQLWE